MILSLTAIKFTDLNYDEISQIPKDHYINLGKTIKSLNKDNKYINKSPTNVFYNPSEGFKAKKHCGFYRKYQIK